MSALPCLQLSKSVAPTFASSSRQIRCKSIRSPNAKRQLLLWSLLWNRIVHVLEIERKRFGENVRVVLAFITMRDWTFEMTVYCCTTSRKKTNQKGLRTRPVRFRYEFYVWRSVRFRGFFFLVRTRA